MLDSDRHDRTFSQALYDAREIAMERMQNEAIEAGVRLPVVRTLVQVDADDALGAIACEDEHRDGRALKSDFRYARGL